MKRPENERIFPMRLPTILESDLLRPEMPAHITLSEARRPQFYYENQKYLGFVPLNNIFEGPIFGRFHGSRPSLIEHISQQRDGTFILNEDLAQSWIRVEYALTIISLQLYNPLLRPLNSPTPSYPSDTKYSEPKPSLKRAIDSVIFAQKLFVFLVAELRHNIALSPRFDKLKTTWVKYIESSPIGPRIDKDWLADLAASKALNTPHLAGYFIDPTFFNVTLKRRLNRFRTYNKNGAPLYVILTKIDRSDPHKAEFAPTLRQKDLEELGDFLFTYQEAHGHIKKVECYTQAQYLAREYPRPPLCPPHISPSASVSTPVTVHTTEGYRLPESLPHSGQDHGKWWYEHLQDQRENYKRKDDPEFTQYRDEEEIIYQENYGNLYNSFQELPEEFSTPLAYAWKPTPLHPHYLLRTPLERSEVRAYWSNYSPSHRIFDIYSSAWDLYDPSCDLNTLTRKAVATIATVDDVEPTTIDAGVEPLTQQIDMPDLLDDRRKTTEYLAKARLQKTRETQFYFEDPLQYAHHRYGIILPLEPFSFNHAGPTIVTGNWWSYLGKNLQDEKFANMDVLSNALGCMVQGHSEHIKKLFDIYIRPRELINDNSVTIQRVPEALFRTIEGNTIRNLYLLRFPRSKQGDWVVGINNAANVVMALRENWASHRINLLRNFLKYGFQVEFPILILQ